MASRVVEMRDVVEARQLKRFSVEEAMGDAAVADLHVERNGSRGRSAQRLLHQSSDYAARSDGQYSLRAVLLDGRARSGDAVLEGASRFGYALVERALGPQMQDLAQGLEELAGIARHGVGEVAMFGAQRAKECVEVVLVQPRKNFAFRGDVRQRAPDSIECLCMTLQRACHDAIETQAVSCELTAEPDALLRALFRKLVVIIEAKRRLPVSHQVEFRHRKVRQRRR